MVPKGNLSAWAIGVPFTSAKRERIMRKMLAIGVLLSGLTGAAQAQYGTSPSGSRPQIPSASCETKAVSKEGKPLTGAARTSFVNECKKTLAKRRS